MACLGVWDLHKAYSSDLVALHDLSFQVADGEFFTILGPTNAGKTTLLKTIGGVERADRGKIRLGNRFIETLEPRARRLSLLFQNIALFPNRSGFDNIGFALRTTRLTDAAINARVREVAALLKVDHLLNRLPRTYSGGEQQRVAIGRAIALPTELLMLDEPLTNLDARIRISLRLEFKRLHQETGQTILYVTHDHVEAMSLSSRIGVLKSGRFEQIGTPDDLYQRPASEFVARFLGSPPMNIIAAELKNSDGELRACGKDFAALVHGSDTHAKLPEQIAIGVRPEEIFVSPEMTSTASMPGDIAWVEELGSHRILDVKLGNQLIKVRTRADHPVRKHGPAWFGFTVLVERILDRETGLFVRPQPGQLETHRIEREDTSCV